MVSGKERFRIARQIDRLNERIHRQKDALTRLGLANTEMAAALFEIANMDPPLGMEDDNRGERAVAIARAAIESVAVKASAAIGGDTEESTQDPNESEEP